MARARKRKKKSDKKSSGGKNSWGYEIKPLYTKTELKNGDVSDDLTKIWNKNKGVWEDSLAVYKQSDYGKYDIDDVHYNENNLDVKYAREVKQKIKNRAEELYKEKCKKLDNEGKKYYGWNVFVEAEKEAESEFSNEKKIADKIWKKPRLI